MFQWSKRAIRIIYQLIKLSTTNGLNSQWEMQTFANTVRSRCTHAFLLPEFSHILVILITGIVNTLATEQNIVDSRNWVVSSAFLFGDLNRCDITTVGANLEKCNTFHTRLHRALYLCLKPVPVPVFPRTSRALDLNRQQLLTFFSQRRFAFVICYMHLL